MVDIVTPTASRSRRYDRVSRAIDLMLASVALAVLAPLMACIWVVVRLDSSGPGIFRQERIGRFGRPFILFKFRTMRLGESDAKHRLYVTSLIDASHDETRSEETGRRPVFKLVDDDRITTVGRFLRRTSLDELPQLVNVINGTMSLVGPRPGLAYEVELYGDFERQRLAVAPGLTGLWQVSGRNNLSMREMFELDARYVNEHSITLYLLILARTPREIIAPSGAQ